VRVSTGTKYVMAPRMSGITPAASATCNAANGAASCMTRNAMVRQKAANVEATRNAGIVCSYYLRVKSMTISLGSRERYSILKASPYRCTIWLSSGIGS